MEVTMTRLSLIAFCSAICLAQTPPESASDRFSQLLRGGSASGFRVAARNGATGQALVAQFTGQQSARAAFIAAMRQAAPYFDKRPVLQSAIGDAKDQQVQAFFRASYQGAPVRGLIAVTAQNGSASAAIFFDREALFAQSLPVLARQAAASLPQPQSAPPAPPQLTRTRLPDGSGVIGLAPGWRIGDAVKGALDAAGPHGELLSLGIASKVLPSMPGRGPYRPPWPAFQMYVNILNKGALANGRMTLRLIEQHPDPFRNGEAAWIAYEATTQGQSRRGLAWVATARMASDIGAWFFYYSLAAAPADIFGRELPTMIAMWKSWGVNQEVFRERMDSALRSMHEINRMIQETNDYRSKTFDNANYGWTETFRGVTMIEEAGTRARWEVNTDNAQWWVDALNQQGYNFRIVPLNQLVWDLSNR